VLIAGRYRNVRLHRVIGHSEVTGRTVCPSALFMDSAAGAGWKRDLDEMIAKASREGVEDNH
jgi:hypothetical protein